MLNPTAPPPAAPSAGGASTVAPSFPDQLTFLSTICGSLKLIKRTGWVRSGIPRPESDADHMHRCAMSAMLISQPPHPDDVALYEKEGEEGYAQFDYREGGIDANKLLRMAVTHDLCESIAGDVTPHCHEDLIKSKEATEDAAMREIRRVVGDPLGGELYDLWREYEDQETIEAVYCKDIDKFEMVCQAYEYERDHLAPKKEGENGHDGGEKEDEDKKAGGDVSKKIDGEGGDGDAADPPAAKKPRTADGGAAGKREGDHLPPKVTEPDGAITEPLRTFFVSTNSVMKTPLFRRLDGDVRTRREEMLKGRGWEVAKEERQQYS